MTDFCWDYGPRQVDTGLIKLEPNIRTIKLKECFRDELIPNNCNADENLQESEVNRSSNGSSTGQSGTCVVEQEKSVADNPSPCMTSPACVPPVSRQFWKAGDYSEDNSEDSTPTIKQAGSRINIHPKFLHSNATSHKWAFGAIAELLDNAVDEIQKGATFIIVDKTSNPRNGSPALLIQDDGAGMDPEALRRCLSFGFSDRKSETAIGKYGNGFKTSSMRLGSDVIVFTRNIVDQTITQSIGLLSYTFLTQSGYDRIVVPMVHYVFNLMTCRFESIQPKSVEQSDSNLQMLLKWSPYSTEEELLKQFEDVGHGTKLIVYNLWLDDEGKMELDFDSDPKDIRIGLNGKVNAKEGSLKAISENHIAKRLWFSLRAYLSVLYRKLPPKFAIYLRREVVVYHNIATELKFQEYILYRAHKNEGSVITTIGFLEEAPDVSIHGFNIYYKNRLILPFLPVVNFGNGKGRGVVGVLDADIIAPTHNKQDFEGTNIYKKLITRLRDMTYEYWDKHCMLIGYQPNKKSRRHSASSICTPEPCKTDAVGTSKSAPVITNISSRTAFNESNLKRKDHPVDSCLENATMAPCEADNGSNVDDDAQNQKKTNLIKEQKKLQEKCLDFEKSEKELNLKATQLMRELKVAENEYATLLNNLQFLEKLEGKTTNAV